jgi:hypothetical protein
MILRAGGNQKSRNSQSDRRSDCCQDFRTKIFEAASTLFYN